MADEIKPVDIDRFGKPHAHGWNSDHSAEVFMLLDDMDVRQSMKDTVHYAYDYGYEHVSDGNSFPIRRIAQLGFQQFNMKHPAGVDHDAKYREGPRHPFVVKAVKDGEIILLPSTEITDPCNDQVIRHWCDIRFGEGLQDCGNWFRSRTWKWGLFLFGNIAYQKYRARETRGDYGHILNKSIIPIKENAT